MYFMISLHKSYVAGLGLELTFLHEVLLYTNTEWAGEQEITAAAIFYFTVKIVIFLTPEYFS